MEAVSISEKELKLLLNIIQGQLIEGIQNIRKGIEDAGIENENISSGLDRIAKTTVYFQQYLED